MVYDKVIKKNTYGREDEYYVFLSKDIVDELKPYIDSYVQSVYGLPYETDSIMCDVETGEYGNRTCLALSKNSKIPISLDKILLPEVKKNGWGYYRDICFEKILLNKNINEKIENNIKELLMVDTIEKI